MIIPCQKEEKECIWIKYFISAVLLRVQAYHHLRVFPPKSLFPKLQSLQKNSFFQVCVS